MYWVLPFFPSLPRSSFSSFHFLKLGLRVFQEFCELQEHLWKGLVGLMWYRAEAKGNWGEKKPTARTLQRLSSPGTRQGLKAMHKTKKNKRGTEPFLSQTKRVTLPNCVSRGLVKKQHWWVNVWSNLQCGEFSLPLEKWVEIAVDPSGCLHLLHFHSPFHSF